MGQPGNALQRARPTVKVKTVATTQPEKRVGVAEHGGIVRVGARAMGYAGGDLRSESVEGGRCTSRERCVSAFSVAGDVSVEGARRDAEGEGGS
jgi:hypothetical protein